MALKISRPISSAFLAARRCRPRLLALSRTLTVPLPDIIRRLPVAHLALRLDTRHHLNQVVGVRRRSSTLPRLRRQRPATVRRLHRVDGDRRLEERRLALPEVSVRLRQLEVLAHLPQVEVSVPLPPVVALVRLPPVVALVHPREQEALRLQGRHPVRRPAVALLPRVPPGTALERPKD